VQKATATIPVNPSAPSTLAKAQDAAPAAVPAAPANIPVPEATPAEMGLSPDAVSLFGDLSASMDQETQSSPEPLVPTAVPPGVQAPVEIPPYEPPIAQRAAGEVPEQLVPTLVETVPLEAAIEQPLAEADLRLTAEQWAQSQDALRAQTPSEPVAPVPQFDPATLEANAIKALTETEYALSDEQATMLIAEPDKVLPELAARMHVRVQVGLANQIAQMLPQMIAAQIQQQGKVQSLESSFFGAYPELNKPEFRTTVQESLAMIRQVNPQASREEVMRDGAALAAVRLRTKLGGVQEPAQLPVLPSMPLSEASVVPPVLAQPAPAQPQAPFVPAQAGGASTPVVPIDPNAGNIFAQLAMDPDW